MTWKRIATAAILTPAVVAIVLLSSTAVVAIATALITVLALREYFALGDAIGHRAYRLWTIFCSIVLVLMQSSSSLLHLDYVFRWPNDCLCSTHCPPFFSSLLPEFPA
jgi:CDP-diglyceride synthetase